MTDKDTGKRHFPCTFQLRMVVKPSKHGLEWFHLEIPSLNGLAISGGVVIGQFHGGSITWGSGRLCSTLRSPVQQEQQLDQKMERIW